MSDAPQTGAPAGRDDDAPRPRRRVRWGRLLLVFGPVLLLGAWLVRRPVLRLLPPLLVTRDAPRSADALVVLAGDERGRRVKSAAALWAKGLVKTGPFVTSGGVLYDELSWARVMAAHAQRLGVPAERIVVQGQGLTTEDEARLDVALLHERGARTLLLVTSPWHSGRAARLFRAQAAPLGIEVVSCPSEDEAPPDWWADPVSARFMAMELLKRLY
jgi:uncharacterized SAM-binding protein YcdF (DUF218 family)